MARNARDLELLLKVIAGPRPSEERSWALNMAPSGLQTLDQARVGLWLEDPLCPVEHELTGGYRTLGKSLADRGALVTEASHPLLSLEHILPAYFNLLGSLLSTSLLGLPATSVPIGRTTDGLPFNVQVIGAPGADLTTIRFARLLEEAGLAGFVKPEGL